MNPLIPFMLHIGIRFAMDSIPQYTYINIIGPFSVMKIYSLTFTIISLFYLTLIRELKFDWIACAFACIFFPLFISTIYHGTWFSFFVFFNKWLYMWIVIIFMKVILKQNNLSKTLKLLLICSLYPMINQIFAIISGYQIYEGNVYRYIGTFQHWGIISLICFLSIPASIYLILISKKKYKKVICLIILTYAHIGIFLASYRTIWIGVFTYWIIFLVLSLKKINPIKKVLLAAISITLVFLILITVGHRIQERLMPISEFMSNPSKFIHFSGDQSLKKTGKLKRTEGSTLYGRIDLWNASMYAYTKAPLEEKIIGLGVGKIEEIVSKYMRGSSYAHNEFITFLVETGVIGLIGLLLWIIIFSGKLLKRLKAGNWSSYISVPVFFSFLIIAMGTMPFRKINAVIFLGLYIGIALYTEKVNSYRSEQT
jgi:hypothetical protein